MTTAKPSPRGRPKRVLLMSSNGGGLGHLTRLLGMARRLPPDVEALFFTLSSGVEVVRKQGYWADYMPGPTSGELRDKAWWRYLERRLVAALGELEPDAFVFDGTFAYRGLLDALEGFPRIHKTWSRRGMWKPITAKRAERSLAQTRSFDLILEPGELAAAYDRGATGEQRHVLRRLEPVLLLDDGELLSREQARRSLSIPQDRVAVLLNLGAGNINSIDGLVAAVVDILRQRPDVHVVALQSLIAVADLPASDRITRLQTYPLSRVLRAFDLCVAAPGYNSFHELLHSAIPTVFIPNDDTVLDDQRARAAWAQEEGLARLCPGGEPDLLRGALADLLRAETRRDMRLRLEALPPCGGAQQAADLIARRASSVKPSRVSPWGRLLPAGERVLRQVSPLARRLGQRRRGGEGDRVLLRVDGETPSDGVGALVDEHTRGGRPPLVMAPGDALRSWARRGLTVELLLEDTGAPAGEGAALSAYRQRRREALWAAYGITSEVRVGASEALGPRLPEGPEGPEGPQARAPQPRCSPDGTAPGDWTVPPGRWADSFLQGFTAQTSVHPGDAVDFKLSTTRAALFVRVRVYRLGGEGRQGGRQVHCSPPVRVPQTGIWERPGDGVDLDRWQTAYRLRTAAQWRTGCYLARFETPDGEATLHPFWVTDARPTCHIARVHAVLTHSAGNRWGRTGLQQLSWHVPLPGLDRWREAPLHRPYLRAGVEGVLRSELPFQRWADAHGLRLDSLTDLEVHQHPGLLAGYEHVTLAGEIGCCTRELLRALTAHRDAGGALSVFGAAPGRQEVTVDAAAHSLTVRGLRSARRRAWRRDNSALWLTDTHWQWRGRSLDLCLAPRAVREELGPRTAEPTVGFRGLCGDGLSGTALGDDDPRLLGRTRVEVPLGVRVCDTVLADHDRGGRIFVAGTDRWTWGLDDRLARPDVGVSPALAGLTARILSWRSQPSPHRALELSSPPPAAGYDVVLLSEFRFPGGTSFSNAEEIKAQAGAGLRTGLLQVASPVLRQPRPVNPAIRQCLEARQATWIHPTLPTRCKLLVVRHPSVLTRSVTELPRVQAEAVVVIANQPPLDRKHGRRNFDIAECQQNARDSFSSAGTWFPIGPLVRRELASDPSLESLSPRDWVNIIDVSEWRMDRRRFVSDRPVIGRHTRDAVDKWPSSAEVLRQAYPTDGSFRVRILGGAEVPRELLGGLPEAWEVLEFGAQSARDFLASIDFLVYYHHPQWVEAFGRTILEALASGVVAILPPHFSELFEDAAVYTEPAGVRGVVNALYGDRREYERRSRRGVELVERRFGHGAHLKRLREQGVR